MTGYVLVRYLGFLVSNMDPRDPYDQRQRRARREKGGVIKCLEIPTTEDSTDPDEWFGRSLREPSRLGVSGWWLLGWPISISISVLCFTREPMDGGAGVRLGI